MKLFTPAPLIILSAMLAGSTALSPCANAACANCGNDTVPATAVHVERHSGGARRTIFPSSSESGAGEQKVTRGGFRRPIFGDEDCSRNNNPMFGDGTCTKRKCGGAMFGPQTCKRVEVPCETCKKKPEPEPAAPREAFIQNYKVLPQETVYQRAHKCSELAPFQLEWVDFRIQDPHSEGYSRKLGNYRFRLFGCRRFSKNAMLNEGRIIQKNMAFIDIFEDLVEDCYNIVKVPNDLCLRDQDYEAPEYILTAEITDYFMNVCDGYDWDNAASTEKRTGSAEMTVTWRLLDLTKTKVLWKGETTGYSELDDGIYNGEMDLIERAFADASLNLKGLPEFEEQLAQRVAPEMIEQQKTTLLAIEQASDPVKCKIQVPQATSCPIPTTWDGNNVEAAGAAYGTGMETTGATYGTGMSATGMADGTGYVMTQQCPMPAEMIEYIPQETSYVPLEYETIPIETGTMIPYAENAGNICYGYNTNNQLTELDANTIEGGYQNQELSYPMTQEGSCAGTIINYVSPQENLCGNTISDEPEENCDPALVSFITADQECLNQNLEEAVLTPDPEPQICMFAEEITSEGGISKDSGYYIPEVEIVEEKEEIVAPADWKPYEEPQPEPVVEQVVKISEHSCIENIAPYPDMRPENLYRVRRSMMSVRNNQNKESAGLLIADDLLLTSADLVNDNTLYYDVETINGVKAKAKLVRVNIKKNIALLQTKGKMYFRPLSMNLELPQTGQGGYMSLGLLNNAEGENYLDDKGTIKGYRFSDEMGTEIITDTFVQTVSSGGALIDEKGVVTGIASRTQRFDDTGDLFLPIQDAINSVELEVCGQQEPFIPVPKAVVPSVASLIDNYTGSKEPAAMTPQKRK